MPLSERGQDGQPHTGQLRVKNELGTHESLSHFYQGYYSRESEATNMQAMRENNTEYTIKELHGIRIFNICG